MPAFESHLTDSNRRPADYKSAALPAELKWLYLERTASIDEYKNKDFSDNNQNIFFNNRIFYGKFRDKYHKDEI